MFQKQINRVDIILTAFLILINMVLIWVHMTTPYNLSGLVFSIGALYLLLQVIRNSSPLFISLSGLLIAFMVTMLVLLNQKISSTGELLNEGKLVMAFFFAYLVLGLFLSGFVRERQQRKLSKAFYIISIALLNGIIILISILISYTVLMPVYILVEAILAIPVLVVWLMIVYKMWDSIQDGHALMTPKRAVLYSLIPLFNIYWMLQIIWGFSKNYNDFIERHSIKASKLSDKLFLGFVLLNFGIVIPKIGMYLAAVNYFITLLIIIKICNSVNMLPDTIIQAQPVQPDASKIDNKKEPIQTSEPTEALQLPAASQPIEPSQPILESSAELAESFEDRKPKESLKKKLVLDIIEQDEIKKLNENKEEQKIGAEIKQIKMEIKIYKDEKGLALKELFTHIKQNYSGSEFRVSNITKINEDFLHLVINENKNIYRNHKQYAIELLLLELLDMGLLNKKEIGKNIYGDLDIIFSLSTQGKNTELV